VYVKILGICALCLLCLQCSIVHSNFPEGRKVIVTEGDADKTVDIAVGDVVQIQLSGTPSTGFWWYFEFLDEQYLEVIKKETKELSPEKKEGAPILGTWQLRAKKEGKTIIRMAYYRSWEGGDRAREHFCLTVHIRAERR
jgi:predicted secreted protein